MAKSGSIRSSPAAARSQAVVSPDSMAFYCSVYVLVWGNDAIIREKVPDGL
jgi:hypothetical protein